MEGTKFTESFSIDDIDIDEMVEIYQYWLDVKGDKLMPSRADINPVDIPKLLPNITLARVEDDGRYKITLVGSKNVNALGVELTGKYLDEIGPLYDDAKWRYDWLVENKRPYIYEGKHNWSEKNYLDFSVIGLPLSENGEDVNGMMFASFYYFPNDQRTFKTVFQE